MKYKKKCVLYFTFAILSASLSAHGAKDIEDKDVSNFASWQESFDLEKKKPGKYNILVTATDMGGNETVEGPFNLFVDPESDLPVCGITNPHKDMRIVGNLNIVGTCIDDDAVDRVVLILDGDESNPIPANGREFWSYYLDTRKLNEGPHTIKVIGYDINGLASEPVSLSWNLDRRQPVTAVNNYGMGILVSGNVKFSGTVADGNGIESLSYSIDNGETFKDLKLSKKQDVWNFNVSVDTRKYEDGPAVIWFKAKDNAGSTGVYSFLYFIDNTKPDVKILKPEEKAAQYGKVAVAGYAKDTLGITDLSWRFGEETGDFDLVPGNPYWGIVFDTAGSKDSSRKFTVTAKDLAGNVISVSRNILLNQELDKPTVLISEPVSGAVIETEEELFVRGIASDDNGVKSIKYNLDGGEFTEQETKGVFYAKIAAGADLAPGKHRVSVIATDKNGVEGNPVTVEFSARGPAPVFGEGKLVSGKDSIPAVNGITVHPEAGYSFQVTASSGLGLSRVHWDMSWGSSGVLSKDEELKGVSSNTVTIPISPDMPKGVIKLSIRASDTSGRETDYKTLLNITNTSVVTEESPQIVFSDSTVGEDGVIVNNADFPASGYFTGGTAAKVEIVPRTPFAGAELHGNSIVLVPGNAVGVSEPVVVRVTTDQGLRYESRKLIFKSGNIMPELTVNGASEDSALDGSSGMVSISGTAKCAAGLSSLNYRVFSAKAVMMNGAVTGLEPVAVSAPVPVKAGTDGAFSIQFNPGEYGAGIYTVEITAEGTGGNKTSQAVCVRNIPELPAVSGDGKPVAAKAPMIAWMDGEDVYYAAVYQGTLDRTFGVFRRADMSAGSNALSGQVTVSDGKQTASKYTAFKAPQLQADFAFANDRPYMSGMPVTVGYGGKSAGRIIAYIDTGASVSSAVYEITGADVPGGSVNQSGSAKLTKPEPGSNRWTAEIPLSNIPARLTDIKLSVKAGTFTKELRGTVAVVRPSEESKIEDNKAVYVMEDSGTVYDADSASYVMTAGSKFNFYANVPGPVSAELVTPGSGLSLAVDGKNIILTAAEDGTFTAVSIRVKDANGIAYNSPAVNFIVDSGAPEVNIATPSFREWLKNSVRITGTAADPAGVKSAEYSVDGGQNWLPLNLSVTRRGAIGATFSGNADISGQPEGLIKIDVRVFDTAGHAAVARTAAAKDTVPPEVQIVMPADEDVVNGNNIIAFSVKDAGSLEKAFYVSPPLAKTAQKRIELAADNFIMTHIGSPEQPIDEAMSFEFADEAGNVNSIEAWKFNIDSTSDLPQAEIHLPSDNEVITRDFTVSGVVYDDDGPSSIWYKIDNGEYRKLPEEGTSFAIDVPFSTMTDNEHTVYVYAVDINGVRGPVVERKFRISTEEPKGAVSAPTIDTSVKGLVTIKGDAFDKNGIDKVFVSLDNGNSYDDAVGQESWSYTFDTRAIPNGTQVVFIKVFDKYGIQGLYSSLINIDNEAPEMTLELPLDYSITAGSIFFSGNAFDNVDITELYITIRSLEQKSVARSLQRVDFNLDRIITQSIDISSLDNGFYNIELTALDKAGNATHVSRNIELNKNKPLADIYLLYPLNGEHKQGMFNIYGEVAADRQVENLSLYIDDKFTADTQITDSGYFRFNITPELLTAGVHTYRVDAHVEGGTVIKSRVQTLDYSPVGPWITIDNFTYGDFAIDRPYIQGNAGYSLDENELLISKTKKATKEQKKAISDKQVAKVELSFDNGKTFKQISKNEKWMYRIENQDLAEGFHFMLLRATMRNGETAIVRTIVQIDNTAPKIRLISPDAGGRYNQSLVFSGLSSDDVGLESVKLTLRKGDKSSYELPSFIQGLYLDWNFWGATLFDIGIGLTFFDDNVKLQFQWGQFTQAQRNIFAKTDMRYGGDNVMGIKILANVGYLPFSYFLGRDWEWLSASFAVGANFTRFNETNSGKPQVLSALLAQIEFPKVKFPNMKMFSSFSFYTEFSLWFIPTDVSGSESIKNLVPQISEGIRLNVF